MIITNHGQIGTLALPDGWNEGQPDRGMGLALTRNFFPPDNQGHFALMYRGVPVTEASGNLLSNLLMLGERELTAAQMRSLDEILMWIHKTPDFQLKEARIISLNGRNVLMFQGSYVPNETDYYIIMVQVPTDPTLIQEIRFSAPKAQFARYMPQIQDAIANIQWVS